MSLNDDIDFDELEKLCAEGVHCPCFGDGEPCCFCDRLAGEVTDEDN